MFEVFIMLIDCTFSLLLLFTSHNKKFILKTGFIGFTALQIHIASQSLLTHKNDRNECSIGDSFVQKGV
jgi:hypothetical protein